MSQILPSVRAVVGTDYRTEQVPVDGGLLTCGVWEPSDANDQQGQPIVLIHGITSSHLAWAALANLVPDHLLIAPDLRGRGGSRELPGPYGMARHADDVAAAIRALAGEGPVTVVGHSMGGFVSVVLADRHPELVSAVVLIDGGMPLTPPPGVSPEQLAQLTLGPAAARLEETFADRAAYQEYWRAHPAFSGCWSELIEAYADYDLVGVEPAMRPATRVAALQDDIRELVDGDSVLGALERLRHPVSWLLAPRGLMDEVPPLYPAQAREHWMAQHPQVQVAEVEDVNHYSIVLSRSGAADVLPWVQRALAVDVGAGGPAD